MAGDMTLRVTGIESEEDLEAVRDALDELGAYYEHVRSEPENEYPQTAYFAVEGDRAGGIENVLAQQRGFDAEVF